ncbi:MAG: hypothetical protein GWN64_07725 [Candidatus Thorarchaeota archaeon]|nr:hypothetical protein [Candidatus Thorarchaeota archaeon]
MVNRTAILTPQEFFSRTWRPNKLWCLRSTSRPGSNFTEIGTIKLICKIGQGKLSKDTIITEKAPDDEIIVQGNYRGDFAEITFEKEAMGVLTRAPDYQYKPWKTISRLELQTLIGYENINYMNELIEMFSEGTWVENNPIIEFSYYNKPVGIHNHPLIIWEIRHY